MRLWRIERSSAMTVLATGCAVVAVLAVALPYLGLSRLGRPEDRPIRTAKVRKIEWLTSAVNASGRVASANNTEIRCVLERTGPSGSGSVGSDGASTILSLVPDGTMVTQGQLLCELDDSAYTELVRRQTIGVKKAQAEHLQAELGLRVAQINLQSFLEGIVRQTDQQFKGQIALARSNLGRQSDRVLWAQRMLEKGYLATSGYQAEKQSLLVQKMGLEQIEMSYQNYQRYTVPKELRALQSEVEGAKATLSFQATRLKLEEARLAAFEAQVERCKIRAPHDGFLIYANESDEPPKVFEGASVRQRQRLFNLPDLSKMEVQALIHETVVDLVRPAMPARIGLEALPGRLAEGRVMSVTQFPLLDRNSSGRSEVKYYLAVIQLDRMPSGLRPGMSAEVEITTARRPSVLVVPQSAVAREGGRDVCYVLDKEGVERRLVKVGQRTPELFEIVDGLHPGEEVSLDPARTSLTVRSARPERVVTSAMPGEPAPGPSALR